MKTRQLAAAGALSLLAQVVVALLVVLFLSAFGGCAPMDPRDWGAVGVGVWLLVWWGLILGAGRRWFR